MKNGFVNLRSARSKEYKDVLETIAKTKKCPFCKKNFKYHQRPILKKENGWFITESSWPYKNTKHHLLIIAEKHKESFADLKTSDFQTIANLANWAIKKYKIKGGALILRFGKPAYTGATVNHLHFHIIVPEIGAKKAEVVHFPIG